MHSGALLTHKHNRLEDGCNTCKLITQHGAPIAAHTAQLAVQLDDRALQACIRALAPLLPVPASQLLEQICLGEANGWDAIKDKNEP